VFKFIRKTVERVRSLVNPPETPGSLIAPCIRAEEGEFVFYLNPLMLRQIEGVRLGGDRLIIPPRQLARILMDLRQLVVIDTTTWGTIQSALTFKTFYVGDGGKQGQFLLRTVLSPDGDIINQVGRELLDKPECLRVVQSHNWLINELLSFLQLRTTQLVERVAWAIAMLTIWIPDAILVIRNLIVILQDPGVLQQVLISLLLWVVLPAVIGTFLGFVFRDWLIRRMMTTLPRLSSWALRELFTSRPTLTKRIAQQIWGQFGV
jgi:hypothetical protein